MKCENCKRLRKKLEQCKETLAAMDMIPGVRKAVEELVRKGERVERR